MLFPLLVALIDGSNLMVFHAFKFPLELAEEKSNAANTLIEKNDLIQQLTQRVESMEAS